VNNFSYRRALIKISGDTFGTPRDINISLLQQLVHEISAIQPHVELSFMIGGGNLFRGRDPIPGITSIVIDKIGMISTLINALIFEHLWAWVAHSSPPIQLLCYGLLSYTLRL